jgi:hypothetical protein
MNKLFNNPKSARIAIWAFIVLFVFVIWKVSDAEAETVIGVGAPIVSGNYTDSISLTIAERWDDKWQIDLTIVGEQDVNFSDGMHHLGNNFSIGVQRIVRYRQLEVGVGVSKWQNTNRAFGCDFTLHPSVAWRRSERWAIAYDHWSNAGTCAPNSGLDMIGIRVYFQ